MDILVDINIHWSLVFKHYMCILVLIGSVGIISNTSTVPHKELIVDSLH